MIHSTHDQPSPWESILPPELFRMSEELAEMDKLPDDERFFGALSGRDSLPMWGGQLSGLRHKARLYSGQIHQTFAGHS